MGVSSSPLFMVGNRQLNVPTPPGVRAEVGGYFRLSLTKTTHVPSLPISARVLKTF